MRKQAMEPKRYQKTLNIQQILSKSGLAKVMQKGLLICEINQQIQQLFPPQFKGLYKIANIEPPVLSIEVANAMVRQSLLFRQQELLALVQAQYPEISSLRFTINPNFNLID